MGKQVIFERLKTNKRLVGMLPGALVLSALLVFCSADCQAFRNLTEGEPAPDFELKDLQGKPCRLSALKGNIALIAYWRPGQKRSEDALEELQKLSERFSDQPLKILAITKDVKEKASIEALCRSRKITYPILLDEDGAVYSSLGVFVFPATALIDKKGIYRFHYGGFRYDYLETMADRVRLALGLVTPEELEKERRPHDNGLTDAQRKAIDHINLGKKLQERGLDEKAFQEFETAAALDPKNIDANVLLGFSLLDLQEIDRAIQCFEAALALNKRATDPKIGLGKAYRMKGETERALEILKSGIVLCPDSSLVHYELGKIYESMNRLADALRHYKESAECSMKMKRRSY